MSLINWIGFQSLVDERDSPVDVEIVIKIAKAVPLSHSREYEIIDINKAYSEQGELPLELLWDKGLVWFDVRTHVSLLEVAQFVKTIETCCGYKGLFIDAIVSDENWWGKSQLYYQTNGLKQNGYSAYSQEVANEC